MHFCSYLHDEYLLPESTVEALEQQVFDLYYSGSPTSLPLKTDNDAVAISETLSRLATTTTLFDLTGGNRRLCERIAHDAVAWCNNQLAQAPVPEAVERESAALEASAEVEQLLDSAGRYRPSLRDRIERYRTIAASGDAGLRARVYRRARSLWHEAVERDARTHRYRELGRSLGAYARELQELVPRLAGIEHSVRDLFGTENALYDSSVRSWSADTLGELERCAATLAASPELLELAEVVGRSREVTVNKTEFREIRHERLEPVGVGKGEVTGIEAGDDVASMIASESALLADPATEEAFYAKLARRQLLSLQFRRPRLIRTQTLRTLPVVRSSTLRRGPAIVCIDTSGSMLGEPERVARALVFALCAKLREHGRAMYVIAFSTQIRVLHVDPAAVDLAAVASFLSGGFHGGTDLRPALEEAMRVLSGGALRLADVVVVSDFRVPKIADRYQQAIGRHQAAGTIFHSVTVARAAVIDPEHIFDAHWLYDLSREHPGIDPKDLRRTAREALGTRG